MIRVHAESKIPDSQIQEVVQEKTNWIIEDIESVYKEVSEKLILDKLFEK